MKNNKQATQTDEPKSLIEVITDKWIDKVREVYRLEAKNSELQEQLNRKYIISLN